MDNQMNQYDNGGGYNNGGNGNMPGGNGGNGKDRAPFELSGGQKRRVAIAGIIAMQPKMLILDEPTAGLDPFGKEQILNLIKYLKTHCSPTIVVISHDIDEITRFANRIVVFNDSRIVFGMRS